MTQYANFDGAAPDPKQVTGWYDTDAVDYPNMPAPSDLLQVSAAQWDARMSRQWGVSGNTLVPWEPPPVVLTPAQEAGLLMSLPVIVQCVAVPALNATYPNSESVRQTMTSIAAQINAGFPLPGGGTTFNWPDIHKVARSWPKVEFIAFTHTVANFIYACRQTVDGFSPVVPSNILTVDSAAVLAEHVPIP